MYATWRLALYVQQDGAQLSTWRYQHSMQQPWLLSAKGSRSQLINEISQEAVRVTERMILPLMKINANDVTALVSALRRLTPAHRHRTCPLRCD